MADYEQSAKEIENSKKRLLLIGKDRKSKSRVAMKFRFTNDRTLDNDNHIQQCYQKPNRIKISNDWINTKINLKNGETGDDVKYCAEIQKISVTKESIIWNDAQPIFDESIYDLNDSFLMPFHRTEDYLIGQKESIGLLTSPSSGLGTSNQTSINQSVSKTSVHKLNLTNPDNNSLQLNAVGGLIHETSTLCSSLKISESRGYEEDPSVTSRKLVSYSEFLNIVEDNNDNSKAIRDNYCNDLDKYNIKVNKQVVAEFQDDEGGADINEERVEEGQNQSETDVQSISTVAELMDALNDNLDFEDTAVSTLEESNADDICHNDADSNNDDDVSADNISEGEGDFDDSNNNSTGRSNRLTNCLGGPLFSAECLNSPNPSLENVSQTSRKIKSSTSVSDTSLVDNNVDCRICTDSTIFEGKECSPNHSLEIYKPEVMILTQIPVMKMVDDIKSSVEQSTQTDELLYGLPATLNQSKGDSPLEVSQFVRALADSKGGKENRSEEGDFIGQLRDELKSSQEVRHLRMMSFRKLDSPSIPKTESFGKDSTILNSPDFSRSPSVTTEALPPFSELDFPNQEKLKRWKLERLAELERRKQEIMDMCQRDIELLYLRKEEKDLKNRLKKVVQKRKALESLKATDKNLELEDASSLPGLDDSLQFQGSGDNKSNRGLLSQRECSSLTESLIKSNRDSSCMNCFDYPKSYDQEKTFSTGDSCCLPSKEVQHFECLESSESSLFSNSVESTDRIASLKVFTSQPNPPESTHSESKRLKDVLEPDSKRRGAFDKLCLLLGPVIKGYIVRRLFKCHKVKEVIKNLMGIAKEVVALFPVIKSEDCSDRDRMFFKILDKQLSSTFNELQKIFTGPSRDRMEILANQRAIERSKIFKRTSLNEKVLSYATRKRIERKKTLGEINSFAPTVSRSSIHTPPMCHSACSIPLNAIPPTPVVHSSSTDQIENSKGFARKTRTSNQLADSRNTKGSGRTLRPKYSSISKKPSLSKNSPVHSNHLRLKQTGSKHVPFPHNKG